MYLLLQHVSGVLIQELATLLKPAGITPEQYHALRILRDAGPEGIPLSVVAVRAVANDPDVTRLLDRLEHQGWATRNRDADDRRVLMARITSVGSRLLGRLDAAVAELHERQLGKRRRGSPTSRSLVPWHQALQSQPISRHAPPPGTARHVSLITNQSIAFDASARRRR